MSLPHVLPMFLLTYEPPLQFGRGSANSPGLVYDRWLILRGRIISAPTVGRLLFQKFFRVVGTEVLPDEKGGGG